MVLLAATPAPTPTNTTDYAPYIEEIQRLQFMLTAQAQSPYQYAQFGMPVPPQPVTALSVSRPREFYSVGYMVGIIPTMDQHVKSWGQILRTQTT